MTARRILLIVALAALGVAALRDLSRLGDSLPWNRLYDFQDFYCAGSALDQGGDPYRYEPLHRCEHAVNRSAAYRADPARVVPAPLPPYDFPPLRLLARVPFANARVLDALAVAAAVAASMAALTVVGVPLDVAVLALLLPAGYLLLDAGQIVPFALLALVLGGAALARGRDALAGFFAALCLVEPHLGLPAFVAVLVVVARARIAALSTAIVLALAALWSVGAGGIVEYVTRVLPAQAAAETGYVYQYSLTYLLAKIGLPAGAALLLGQLSYLALLIYGIALARRLAAVLKRRELIAYLPAAFSVIAGSYVHMVDLAIAIPAALVLAYALRGRSRLTAALAVCLLAVPWITVWIVKKLFLATILVVALLLWRLEVGVSLALAAFCVIAAAIYAFELHPPAPFPVAAATNLAPNDLAQNGWAAYVAAIGDAAPGWFLIKIPTWLALVGLLAAGTSAARRPPETT